MNTIVQSEPIIETAQVVSAVPLRDSGDRVAAKAKRPPKSLTTAKAKAQTAPEGYVKPKRIADLVKNRGVEIEVELGTDPEFGLLNLTENRIVSSIPILRHDKYDPIDLGDGIHTYSDNTMIEASLPPSKTNDEMMVRLKTVFERLQAHIGNDYRLSTKAAHTYDADQLVPYTIPESGKIISPLLVGCTPSFSGWNLSVENPAEFGDGMRSGSFHLHLGSPVLTEFKYRIQMVKLMDLFVGLPSVIFDKDPTNVTRRLRYGRSSSHRLPQHGIEYRVLSCAPLGSRDMTTLCLDLTQHAIDQLRKGRATDLIYSINVDEVQQAINTCDASLARKIIAGFDIPSDLMARIEQPYKQNDLYQSWGLS